MTTSRANHPTSISPQTGGSPDPSHVVGRDELIARLVAGCRSGTNYLLADPRRMGKTSVLIRLCDEPGPDVIAVKADLQGVENANQAVARVMKAIADHRSLSKKARDAMGKLLASVTVKAGPVELTQLGQAMGPLPALESAMASIADSLDDQLLIICVDEVTIGIENIAKSNPNEASLLLQTLRRLRSEYPSIRWILTGSVGFHHVLRKAESTEGAINDLAVELVGPLAHNHACDLARALCTSIDREPTGTAIDRVVEQTDAIPFIIHQAAHLLSSGSGPIEAGDIDTAVDAYLSDSGKSGALAHLLTRINGYYEQPDLAHLVLDECAASDAPASFDELVDRIDAADRETILRLVDTLVADHYLNDDTMQWRYPVLRRVWRQRRKLT